MSRSPKTFPCKTYCYVMLFVPFGVILAAVLIEPDNLHYFQISKLGVLYGKLNKFQKRTGGNIVDKFASDHFSSNPLRRRRPYNSPDNFFQPKRRMRPVHILGNFPKEKDCIVYDYRKEKKLVIVLTVLLYNFCTKIVGLN